MNPINNCVLIIDAGSQYCKLIDRIVREMCVETHIVPLTVTHQYVREHNYKAIIVSGGPGSVNDPNLPFDYRIFELGIPVLGICFGMQLLVKKSGGKVEHLPRREDAQTVIHIHKSSKLFQGLSDKQTVLLTHGDMCTDVKEFFTVNAITANNVAVSISNDQYNVYGVQFHPEVDLTPNGRQIFHNFIFEISACTPSFTLQNKLDACIRKIHSCACSKQKIFAFVSGGVDSTVTAMLINKAIPDRPVHFLLVDNGFLRRGEVQQVVDLFRNLNLNLEVIDAKNEFINSYTHLPSKMNGICTYETIGPLRSTISPEHKRKIIGNTFVDVFKQYLKKLPTLCEEYALVQGTLRPDLIESASPTISSCADVIKTHHNDSSFVRSLRKKGRIIEPLSDLHKDEVRKLGALLGLPESVVQRHPFPGPGLAIRIICAMEPYFIGNDSKYDIPSLAEFIANYGKKQLPEPNPLVKLVKESLSAYDYEQLVLASSGDIYLTATHLPILTVGIQGDERSYKNVIALSCDQNIQDWGKLMIIAKLLPKICLSINRVVFCFGKAINEPIRFLTPTFLTPDVIETCRIAHHMVDSILVENCNSHKISQFPIVLIPIQFDEPSLSLNPLAQRSLVLRPFVSQDFMTGIPAVPGEHLDIRILEIIVQGLSSIPNISRILYDLTPKPPGTTEWE